jgi:hypothetical protein
MKRETMINDLIQYILESENDDFFEQLEDLGLSENEIQILNDWNNDDFLTLGLVEPLFLKLADRHIYATAMVLLYKFESKDIK